MTWKTYEVGSTGCACEHCASAPHRHTQPDRVGWHFAARPFKTQLGHSCWQMLDGRILDVCEMRATDLHPARTDALVSIVKDNLAQCARWVDEIEKAFKNYRYVAESEDRMRRVLATGKTED
jgi:hypothetical protein